MSRRRGTEKLEQDLELLEAHFEERLVAGLRACAAGAWGLFDTKDWGFSYGLQSEGEKLSALCDEVQALRERLGFAAPNPLCARFRALRESRGENEPGDPKRAATLLAEVEAGEYARARR